MYSTNRRICFLDIESRSADSTILQETVVDRSRDIIFFFWFLSECDSCMQSKLIGLEIFPQEKPCFQAWSAKILLRNLH